MPRFVFLRHGEPQERGSVPNVQRRLTDLGETQARNIGQVLQESGFEPDLVIFSDARRTEETATIIVATFPFNIQFVEFPGLRKIVATREEYDLVVKPIEDELGDTAPFSEYLLRDTDRVLMKQANCRARELCDLAAGRNAQQVLVVGHHLNQNAIGIALSDGESDEFFMGPFFGHAEGFMVDDQGRVTPVKRT